MKSKVKQNKEEILMAKVTKDMTISQILSKDVDNGIAAILRKSGMNCVGCPSAANETLEQASSGHGMDADALLDEINVFLETAQA
jgi:hybrid cluster-associated redox disulfide protein